MASPSKPRQRRRGAIDVLPSGSLRVRVFAGVDPVSGKRHDLVEIVPAGPKAAAEAEKVRTRLLRQVDEKRNSRTRATVSQLIDRYLAMLKVEDTTREGYESIIRNHIRPLLGNLHLSRIDGEILDSFYKQLRTCRVHCRGRAYIEHYAKSEHDCDARCRPHECRPLADSSLRKVQALLSGAGKRAVRWQWLGVNPFDQAEPIAVARPNPQPPTAEQAAAIVTEAWADLDWGMLVWLAMITGARRGELCALRWDTLDLTAGVLTIRSSIAQRGARTWEKDTKTHQQRRITIDPDTLVLLRAFKRHCAQRIGFDDMPGGAFIFSNAPDGRNWLKPDSVSQRYARMCARLGWDMNIHQLRHYSATELITSGVDITTVSGRLGHGGGGSTTLRFYSAWVAEADQRAAGTLAGRMPAIPRVIADTGDLESSVPSAKIGDSPPYQRIAADLRGAISCGVLQPGDRLPTMAELADRYGVAFGTAQRALAELKAAGLVDVTRGRRAVVANPTAGSSVSAKVFNMRGVRHTS